MKSLQYLLIIILLSAITLRSAAQVPILNSYPSASATVFLDFDGQYVSGSVWNWSGPINAMPSGFNNAAITEIFNRVAEDYRPFDLNITTDSANYWNAPANKRTRIIITPTSGWYGSAGGVSFVGSFTWGDNTPAWVFSALLLNNIKYVAEAISHETGHTLGLQHQSTFDVNCVKTAEYSVGQGSGEIGWAPIMGAGYYQNLTTWHVGPNTSGCNTIQNDFNIISTNNGFGLRPDDNSDSVATATNINVFANAFTVTGLINNATDVDAFKIVLPSTNNFKLTAIPQNVGAGDAGANIDIKVTLMNATDTIGYYNPSTLLNAGVDTNLNAGTYYLLVDGVGNMYHNDLGSMGFYTLVGSVETVLPLANFNLKGSADYDMHKLSWDFQTDETITSLVIESSTDGKRYNSLTKTSPDIKTFSYKPLSHETVYYRIKAVTLDNQIGYLSNTIAIKDRLLDKNLQVVANSNTNQVTVTSNSNFDYQLFSASGQLLATGKLQQGTNQINTQSAKGLLLLHYCNETGSFVQKLIKQ